MNPRLLYALGIAAGAAWLQTRVTVPRGIAPIQHFNLDRYLGRWYEIARIDHAFEAGLIQTEANYARMPGGVRVVNRGYDPVRGRWKQSVGKAKFLGPSDVAALKVSFFGPFYGGYNVVHLSDDGMQSLVIGHSRRYFWLLSRTPTLPDDTVEALLAQARALGVDTDAVIRVEQTA
ncbi:hypothetical protein CCO03_16480 [Comamonas serinivorans]|uniref:Outer membrane lipoprotein Blc n=1 Tax=Comamonas serinivorans TaxID=1082851 RepID=A0A1Y0ETE3_9BURK|nr:lipocalin family protein [Comamonas serinivorans]ARU06937.1 hypothetical protein CCO03_16480 [Comamonas serinivorans]